MHKLNRINNNLIINNKNKSIDEKVHERPWTLTQTAKDALAASMIVFILLDLWRISFPSIISNTQVGNFPLF